MRLACVMCHGPGGHGGSTMMMGAWVQAPDITWPTLTSGDRPFTEDTVRRAITSGIDETGQPLAPQMPHWSMAPADLDDLVGFLKTLR